MRFVKIVLLVFLFVATAKSDETTLRTSDNGVLGAMHRMGCRTAWLSKVMELNHFSESQLTRMWPGTRIVLPDACNQKPTKNEVNATTRIFSRQFEIARGEQAIRENESLLKMVKEKDAEIKVLGERVETLTAKYAELSKQLSLTQSKTMTFSSKILYGSIGIGFTSLVWLVWRWRLSKIGYVVYDKHKVTHLGDEYEFNLKSILFTCPKHPDQDIKLKNCLNHVKKAHAGDRLKVIVVKKNSPVSLSEDSVAS